MPLNEDVAAFELVPDLHVDAPPFNIIPVATSFIVALGGLGLGYLMYWRKPLKAGEEDPLVGILGPLHPVLANRYYMDDLVRNHLCATIPLDC